MIPKQDIDFSSLKAFLEVSQDCNMSDRWGSREWIIRY